VRGMLEEVCGSRYGLRNLPTVLELSVQGLGIEKEAQVVQEMTKWQLMYAYRRAYFADLVPWILCPDCEVHMNVVDKDDEPALRCPSCLSVFKPGSEVWNQIRRNLDESIELQRAAK
jgi:hypothetical protein